MVQELLEHMKRTTLPAGPGSAESHCSSEVREFSWDVGNPCSTPYLPDLKPDLETEIPQKISAVITWAYRLSFPLLFVPKVMTWVIKGRWVKWVRNTEKESMYGECGKRQRERGKK